MSLHRRFIAPVFFLMAVVTVTLSACSPLYVLEAGWQEAGILLRRQKISRLIESPKTDESLKQKLALVLAARDYAKSLGLEPGGSYLEFTKIDRDVLVWVLSAAPKTSLKPKTWWFPIVGRVPYKGFFKKERALREATHLKEKNNDVFVRQSAAFSTLGWFDDPLLSTMLRASDANLVNTVIHEIFHNTMWIKGSVEFNETLANFIGSRGAAAFFRERDGADSKLAQAAEAAWMDDVLYAEFLADLASDLDKLYKHGEKDGPVENRFTADQIIAERERLFATAQERWKNTFQPRLQGTQMKEIAWRLNNAVIIADRIYLSSPQVFEELYQLCGASLAQVIEELKNLEKQFRKADSPFDVIHKRIEELRSIKGNQHGIRS